MKGIFQRAIQFIKENPSMIYSLVLVVIIPASFFINTYIINSNYEKDIDRVTQRKAVLAENIINNLIDDKINNQKELQSFVKKIVDENKDEIISLSIIKPNGMDNFEVFASSSLDLIGKNQNDSLQNVIAWSKPEGIAFLDSNEDGRFWNVTKTLVNSSNEKVALVAMAFSLRDTDQLINRTIINSYWVLAIIILIVILLVSNQARLFGYAITLSKLKEIDKMKDMFISMAGHELRTPLTAIKGYVDLLKDKKEITSDKESYGFINNVTISIDRLQNLVNDILEVSRLEGNRLPVEITSFDPDPIVKQSVEEMIIKAKEKNLALTYEPSQAPIIIKADENRFKQILINLIGNSIKYTEKGSIAITETVKDNEFLLTVADTGIGISAENLSNLFHKFYRIQNEKTKGITGTGLGLWITLEIVKRMKGNITVESIEGTGSHFTVHLPIAKK